MTQPPNQPQGWWQPQPGQQQGQPPDGQQWNPGGQQNPGPYQGQPQGYQQQPYPQQPGSQQPQPQQQWPNTPTGGQWQQPGAAQPFVPQSQPQQGFPGQPQPRHGSQQPPSGGEFQSAYGGLGAFDGGSLKKKRSKKPLIFGGIGVVALAGAGLAMWLLGVFHGEVLDPSSVQDGVVTVLKDSYGEQDVQNAQCPEDQSATNGTTFDCSVDVAGQPKKVSIRVLNEKPEFEVGAPK